MTAELLHAGISRPRQLLVRDLLTYLRHRRDLRQQSMLDALSETMTDDGEDDGDAGAGADDTGGWF